MQSFYFYQNTHTIEEDLFLYFVKKGNLAFVQRYIAEGGDVNVRNADGLTALMIACNTCNLEMVKALKKSPNLDINARFGDERYAPNNALGCAIRHESLDVVNELLLTPNINVNAKSFWDYSPLLQIIIFGKDLDTKLQIIKMLSEIPGFDINQRDKTNMTPLINVAYQTDMNDKGINPKIIETLLAIPGIDAYAIDDYGCTALSNSIRKNNLSVARLLIAAPYHDKAAKMETIERVLSLAKNLAANRSTGYYDEAVKLLTEAAQHAPSSPTQAPRAMLFQTLNRDAKQDALNMYQPPKP